MRPDPMSKLVLISLCASLLACAERQAEYYIDQLSDPRSQIRLDASHALVQIGGATVEPSGAPAVRYVSAACGHRGTGESLCLLVRSDGAVDIMQSMAKQMGT